MQPKPWSWWIDFILVNSVLLLAESARGVVLGTLWPYVRYLDGSTFFLAVIVAIFSAGRLFASIFFGILSDYFSTKFVLIMSCVSCVGGNFLFIFAGNTWIMSKNLLLVSRILTGFGTGMLSVARTHVSVTTPTEERTLWMSWLGIVQFVGFAVTPVIGSVDVQFNLGILNVNVFTFATFILLLLECAMIVLLTFFMSNHSVKHFNQPTNQSIVLSDPLCLERESSTKYEPLSDHESINQSVEITPLSPIANHSHLQSYGSSKDSALSDHESTNQSMSMSPRKSNFDRESFAGISQPLRSSSLQVSPRTSGTMVYSTNVPQIVEDTAFFNAESLITETPLSTAYTHRRSSELDAAGFQSPVQNSASRQFSPYSSQSPQQAQLSLNQFASPSKSDLIVTVDDMPLSQSVAGSPHQFALSIDRSISHRSFSSNCSDETLDLLAPGTQDSSSVHQSKWRSIIRQSAIPMVFVFLNLSGRGILSVAEAYGTQLYHQVTSQTDAPPNESDTGPASTFFLVLGCLGLVVFLLMSKLTKLINETTLLFISFVAMGVGFGIMVDFADDDIDIYDFSAGMTLVWVIGTPISQTLSVSMLSKYFTREKLSNSPSSSSSNAQSAQQSGRNVGFWMGFVTAAGSVGRIVFPLTAGALYQPFTSSAAVLFASLAAFATSLVIFFAFDAWKPYVKAFKQRFSDHQPTAA